MIFLQRTRKDHRQSEEHWNCFKGNAMGTSDRQGGAHTGVRSYRVYNYTHYLDTPSIYLYHFELRF